MIDFKNAYERIHCTPQESWANASKKQQEKLLELIRRLAEDDKEGIMATKVLVQITYPTVAIMHSCVMAT